MAGRRSSHLALFSSQKEIGNTAQFLFKPHSTLVTFNINSRQRNKNVLNQGSTFPVCGDPKKV
jgi:hypothetical protein